MERKGWRELPEEAVPYPEESLRKIVEIMGNGTASANALSELETRRARGEDAVVYRLGSWFIVGPRQTNANTL
jgi:hypothetical protein